MDRAAQRQSEPLVTPLRSVPETAARLAVTRKVVYGLVHRGELDAIQVGREWRIEDAAIEEFKARSRVHPAIAPAHQPRRPRQRKGEVRHLRAPHKADGGA